MSPAYARLYAAIFGVRESWLLLNGDLPSGLGADVDWELSIHPNETGGDFSRLAAPHLPPPEAVLKKLKDATRTARYPEWTSNAGDMLREIEASTFRQYGLDAVSIKPAAFWPLPKGFVRSTFDANLEDVVVAVLSQKSETLRARERLFIDTRLIHVKEPAVSLILKNCEPCLLEGGPAQSGLDILIVGRVTSSISPVTIRRVINRDSGGRFFSSVRSVSSQRTGRPDSSMARHHFGVEFGSERIDLHV